MKPLYNEEVLEIAMFTYWVEKNNLLVTISKDVERTMENAPEFIGLLEQLVKKNGGKKICILSDVSNIQPLSKEMREYYDEVIATYVTAVVMFSNSKMGSAMAFIYTTMHGNTFDVKVCDNEAEGREWLKDYLSPNPSSRRPAEMDAESDMLLD
jgi:hypothetical protein